MVVILKNNRERERERDQNKPTFSSKFQKGKCQQCQKEDYIGETQRICANCWLTKCSSEAIDFLEKNKSQQTRFYDFYEKTNKPLLMNGIKEIKDLEAKRRLEKAFNDLGEVIKNWKTTDKNNKPPSKFKKGRCPECGRSNVIINPESGLCNSCGMAKLRLMIQQMIREEGLKEGQIEWERVKPQIEQMIRWLKQNGEAEVVKMVEKNIETIEGDLYPNKNKKGSSAWIWVLVIVGVAVVGIISLVLWRKRKK